MKTISLLLVLLMPTVVFSISNYPDYSITHDQYYVIPENADDGWSVGEFHANLSDTLLFERTGKYSFEIVSGNGDAAFQINSETGLLTISDRSLFYGGGDQDYVLDVRVTIDDVSNVGKAYIHVVDSTKCTFVDMDASSGGAGTKASPFRRFSDLSNLQSGHAVFLKRGSQGGYEERINIPDSYTFDVNNPFYIAAYGTGSKPLIKNVLDSYTVNGCTTSASNVWIYDIEVKDFNGTSADRHTNGFSVNKSLEGVELNRCESSNSGYNGEYYIRPDAIATLRDCKGRDNPISHIYKFEGRHDTVISCSAINAPNGNGYSFPGNHQYGGLLAHSYANGYFSPAALSVRGPRLTVKYNYLTRGYRVLEVYELGDFDRTDTLYIHHNIFDTPAGSYAVRLANCDSIRFEDNIILGCLGSVAMFVNGGSNRVHIKRNQIYDNLGKAISVEDSEVHDVDISHNLIYSNGGGINVSSFDRNVKVYNNTVIKNSSSDISNTSGKNVELRNNIYETLSSGIWAPVSNNYDIDEGNPFMDYTNNDFHSKNGIQPIVDAGYNFESDFDIEGKIVPQANWTDIGAFEYMAEAQRPHNGTIGEIPGKIELENFDEGGEGIAWHDEDAVNDGGAYRNDVGVDIYSEDGGSTIGSFSNGEWLEYSVNVESGVYDLVVRSGSAVSGNQLKLYLNNALLKTIDIQNTGSVSTLQEQTTSNVEIIGGDSKILRIESVGDECNVNWIEFAKTDPISYSLTVYSFGDGSVSPDGGIFEDGSEVEIIGQPDNGWAFLNWDGDVKGYSSVDTIVMDEDKWIVANFIDDAVQRPFGGVEWEIPGVIQAEDFDEGLNGMAYNDVDDVNSLGGYRLNKGVDIYSDIKDDDSYVVGSFEVGEWMEYSINVVANTIFNFNVRAASVNDDGQLKIYVDGLTKAVVDIPNTGSLDSFVTAKKIGVRISPGSDQVMRLECKGSSFDFNWIEITDYRATDNDLELNENQISCFPMPVKDNLVVSNVPDGCVLTLMDFLGHKLLDCNSGSQINQTINMEGYKSGLYILQVQNKSSVLESFKIVKK